MEGLPFPTKSFPKTTSGVPQFKGEVGFGHPKVTW